MKVALTMTRNVACVRPEQGLRVAWDLMQQLGVRHVPVVAGAKLEGILSDRDVLVYSNPTDEGLVVPEHTPVERAMTAAPVTCRPTTTVSEVARLMLDNKIDCVPVTDDNEILVGLVTSSDLISLLADREDGALPFRFRLDFHD